MASVAKTPEALLQAGSQALGAATQGLSGLAQPTPGSPGTSAPGLRSGDPGAAGGGGDAPTTPAAGDGAPDLPVAPSTGAHRRRRSRRWEPPTAPAPAVHPRAQPV
jgi:hypothetical protein